MVMANRAAPVGQAQHAGLVLGHSSWAGWTAPEGRAPTVPAGAESGRSWLPLWPNVRHRWREIGEGKKSPIWCVHVCSGWMDAYVDG